MAFLWDVIDFMCFAVGQINSTRSSSRSRPGFNDACLYIAPL